MREIVVSPVFLGWSIEYVTYQVGGAMGEGRVASDAKVGYGMVGERVGERGKRMGVYGVGKVMCMVRITKVKKEGKKEGKTEGKRERKRKKRKKRTKTRKKREE